MGDDFYLISSSFEDVPGFSVLHPQRKALDIWQPDLLTIGGVEACRQCGALAQSYHLPVLPHYYKDYDVTLVCSIRDGVGVESFDWIDALIDNPMVIKDGFAIPHEQPGFGFNFLDEHLEEIQCS